MKTVRELVCAAFYECCRPRNPDFDYLGAADALDAELARLRELGAIWNNPSDFVAAHRRAARNEALEEAANDTDTLANLERNDGNHGGAALLERASAAIRYRKTPAPGRGRWRG